MTGLSSSSGSVHARVREGGDSAFVSSSFESSGPTSRTYRSGIRSFRAARTRRTEEKTSPNVSVPFQTVLAILNPLSAYNLPELHCIRREPLPLQASPDQEDF